MVRFVGRPQGKRLGLFDGRERLAQPPSLESHVPATTRPLSSHTNQLVFVYQDYVFNFVFVLVQKKKEPEIPIILTINFRVFAV